MLFRSLHKFLPAARPPSSGKMMVIISAIFHDACLYLEGCWNFEVYQWPKRCRKLWLLERRSFSRGCYGVTAIMFCGNFLPCCHKNLIKWRREEMSICCLCQYDCDHVWLRCHNFSRQSVAERWEKFANLGVRHRLLFLAGFGPK